MKTILGRSWQTTVLGLVAGMAMYFQDKPINDWPSFLVTLKAAAIVALGRVAASEMTVKDVEKEKTQE